MDLDAFWRIVAQARDLGGSDGYARLYQNVELEKLSQRAPVALHSRIIIGSWKI